MRTGGAPGAAAVAVVLGVEDGLLAVGCVAPGLAWRAARWAGERPAGLRVTFGDAAAVDAVDPCAGVAATGAAEARRLAEPPEEPEPPPPLPAPTSVEPRTTCSPPPGPP